MSNRVFSWISPKLDVRETVKYGKGAFAVEKCNKNELLAVHGGYILTRKEEEALPEEIRDYAVQISEKLVIGIRRLSEREDDGYFNHSCSPNAGYKGQIFLVAMKQINSGDEVTFDYGMVLFQSKYAQRYRIDCQCGEVKCRGVITDNDWKIKELQNKYDGYFQWYLQEKIDRIKKKQK